MDAKITMSFDASIIEAAKLYAAKNNMSLSRLTEYLFRNITQQNYTSIEDLPIASWVTQIAEGEAQYTVKSKTRKKQRQSFFESRKK
jgi:hypothetical protein